MSNVRNFGATGDGVADDTEAIQHTVQQGDGFLEFPRGIYHITKSIEIDLKKHDRTAVCGLGGTALPCPTCLALSVACPSLFCPALSCPVLPGRVWGCLVRPPPLSSPLLVAPPLWCPHPNLMFDVAFLSLCSSSLLSLLPQRRISEFRSMQMGYELRGSPLRSS